MAAAPSDTLDRTSLKPAERRALAALVRRLRDALGDDLVSVWLYGSRARGEPGHDESDVDVLVVLRGERDRWREIATIAWEAAEEGGMSPPFLSVHNFGVAKSRATGASTRSSCRRSTATRSCCSASRQSALRGPLAGGGAAATGRPA